MFIGCASRKSHNVASLGDFLLRIMEGARVSKKMPLEKAGLQGLVRGM